MSQEERRAVYTEYIMCKVQIIYGTSIQIINLSNGVLLLLVPLMALVVYQFNAMPRMPHRNNKADTVLNAVVRGDLRQLSRSHKTMLCASWDVS